MHSNSADPHKPFLLFTPLNYIYLHLITTFCTTYKPSDIVSLSEQTQVRHMFHQRVQSLTKQRRKKKPLKIAAEKKTCTWFCNAIDLSTNSHPSGERGYNNTQQLFNYKLRSLVNQSIKIIRNNKKICLKSSCVLLL